jgi:ribosomal-protein-alanine N-acetyltransferase
LLCFSSELLYGEEMNSRAPRKQPVVILSTPRLILRAATESDIPVLQERIFADSEVMRYAFAGVPMLGGDAEHFMRAHFTFGDGLVGIATLTERSGGDVIGIAGLSPCGVLGGDDFEIGFVLARHAWGRGIATEVGEAQLAFGFDRLGCGRLLGLVEPRNAPSIHALEKLGMRYLEHSADPKRGRRSIYAINADEWRERPTE